MEDLVNAIQELKTYRATLPEGDERDELDAEIAEAETLLGNGEEPAPEPEDETAEMEAEIERLRAAGYDVDADDPQGQEEADPQAEERERQAQAAARNYAAEQVERGNRAVRDSINRRVQSLAESGVIAPSEEETVRCLAYRLAGQTSGVRLYSDGAEGNHQALDDLFVLLGKTPLGTTRTYTQHAERVAAPPSMRINAPDHAQIDEGSAKLAARIKAYAEQKGIKDFGKAAEQMEAELGRDAIYNP